VSIAAMIVYRGSIIHFLHSHSTYGHDYTRKRLDEITSPGMPKQTLPTRAELLTRIAKERMVSVQQIGRILEYLFPDDYLIVNIQTSHKKKPTPATELLIGGYFICMRDEEYLVISPKPVHASDKRIWQKLRVEDIQYICITKDAESRIMMNLSAIVDL
jgi:hypothetical protein